MRFAWDAENAEHIARHNVQMQEVEEVLRGDPLEYRAYPKSGERRFAFVGPTRQGRMLFVVVTLRGNAIRPVTGYDARRSMRTAYADYITRRSQ